MLLSAKLCPLRLNLEVASAFSRFFFFSGEMSVKTVQTLLKIEAETKLYHLVGGNVWLDHSCASLTLRPHCSAFCCPHDNLFVPGHALALKIFQTLSLTGFPGNWVLQLSAVTGQEHSLLQPGLLKLTCVPSWICRKTGFSGPFVRSYFGSWPLSSGILSLKVVSCCTPDEVCYSPIGNLSCSFS